MFGLQHLRSIGKCCLSLFQQASGMYFLPETVLLFLLVTGAEHPHVGNLDLVFVSKAVFEKSEEAGEVGEVDERGQLSKVL